MTLNNFLIREIKQEDNSKIATTIRTVLIEFGVPKIGTAYADKILDTLFEAYSFEKAIYFVVEKNGEIFGGAGIKQLDNYAGNVCELQKMYFSPKSRGKGYGKLLFKKCMEEAKKMGFKQCYLETSAAMEAAIHIYQKNKFQHLKRLYPVSLD